MTTTCPTETASQRRSNLWPATASSSVLLLLSTKLTRAVEEFKAGKRKQEMNLEKFLVVLMLKLEKQVLLHGKT